jgi:hypothetical protein
LIIAINGRRGHLKNTPSLPHVLECLTDFEHIEVEIKAVADEAAAERLISNYIKI